MKENDLKHGPAKPTDAVAQRRAKKEAVRHHKACVEVYVAAMNSTMRVREIKPQPRSLFDMIFRRTT